MDHLLGQFNSLWAFMGLILGFSFLIFIHELGHHLVAKWVGIKVTQFAIGFGPGVVAWRKGIGFRKGSTEPELHNRLQKYLEDNAKNDQPVDPAQIPADKIDEATQALGLGETEYRLNWVPLGGYVKMLGQEDLNPDAMSCNDERSFARKPIWARACVVSAGVVMNLVFGVIFFIVAFMAGVDFPPAIVGGVRPTSPAATTYALNHQEDPAYQGLKPGDRITHIDGNPITDFADVAVETALAGRGQTLRLTIRRDHEPAPLIFPITPKEDPHTKLLALGVGRPISLTLAPPSKRGSLPKILTDAGIQPGMRIQQVAGQDAKRYDHFEQAISEARGQPVPVRFVDPKTGQSIDITLSAVPRLTSDSDKQPLNLLGLVPAVKLAGVLKESPAAKVGLEQGDLLTRIGSSLWPTWEQIVDEVQQAQGKPIRVSVLRNGQETELPPITPGFDGTIGILYGLALDEPWIAQTLPGYPTQPLHLNAGSRILSIDGQPVHSFGDIQRLLSDAVTRATQEHPPSSTMPAVRATLRYQTNIANSPVTQTQIDLGTPWISKFTDAQWSQPLGMASFKMLLIPLKGDHPIAAAKLGIKKAHQVMLQTYITLLRLFQGTVKPSHLRGPLGIADDGTNFAKQGWAYLMFFLGLISINLVVINFLPIPIVDGGLMVFLIVEKLKGSPVSVRIQTAATVVGLAMIGSVFLLTLFYDAKRLLGM